MNILHVIDGLSERAGGTSRAVVDLVSALQNENSFRYSLLVKESTTEEIAIGNLSVDRIPRKGLWEVRRTIFQYLERRHKTDPISLLHLHGLWSPFLHFVIKFARSNQIPYIVAPHGMLEPWSLKQKWLKKKVAWFLYQQRDLTRAAAIHACSLSEKESLQELGLKSIIIVPNGVELPEKTPSSRRTKTVLFLSRIHKKKGIPVLLDAWKQIRPPNWNLDIYGPGDTVYIGELKNQIQKMAISESVSILPSVGGQDKWDVYAQSSIFVLPTHSENFGIVVAEALAAGLPVITTTGTPWSELDEVGCGWCIELSRENLSRTLSQAISLSTEEREAMGVLGREYMKRNFSWGAIARGLVADYRQITGG